MKHICTKCHKVATWFYEPYWDEKIEEEHYFCDECVPRWCECQKYWIKKWDEKEVHHHLFSISENELNDYQIFDEKDSNWNILPCCEYTFDEDWFDK